MSQAAVEPKVAPELEEAPTNILGRVQAIQGFQILILLVFVVVLFTALEPGSFMTVNNLRTIAVNTSILAVLGVGMTFVIITGGIDLSVGSVLVFSGVVASKTMSAMGGQGWGTAVVGVAVSCLCGLAWGILNGVLVSKAKVPALIVTLGTLGMALGLAQIITSGVDIREVPNVLGDSIGYWRIGGKLPVLVVFAGLEETTPAVWDRMIAIGVDAGFHLTRAAVPPMRRQGYGRIVLTTSGRAMRVEDCVPGLVAYSTAKMAQVGLMPLDWFMWANDFPHSVGTWPNSEKFVAETFAEVDEATRRKILLENPAEYFGLDLEADITETPARA